MNFINYSELSGFVDAGFAETEITKETDGDVTTTTIYAGAPTQKVVHDTPPFSQNTNGDLLQDGGETTTQEVWKIRRTIVVEDGSTTTVTNEWAEGDWDDRENLNYQYL